MKKIIQLKNGKLLIETNSNGYVQNTTIKKAYIENGILQKIITFSIWDDFEFNAYSNKNVNELSFEFENDDPIYSQLDKLLSSDKKITIDDDNTTNNLEKFIEIKKVDDKIIINFKGNDKHEYLSQKFNVFVKNIGPDDRSKMQNSDLKIRLIEFFENCEKSLLKEENNLEER